MRGAGDAFVCGWLVLAVVVLLAVCIRSEGSWWSIHNFHPKSLRGMGDHECDGNCYGLGSAADAAKAFRFPEPHLPLCHSDVVASTCGSFYKGVAAESTKTGPASILNAGDLAKRLGLSRAVTLSYLKSTGVTNLASDDAFVFSCKDLCKNAVRVLPSGTVPPASDVGCYLSRGTDLICDIDLSDAALVAAARSEEATSVKSRELDSAYRVLADSSPPQASTTQDSIPEDVVKILVANMFNIYPALNVSIRTITNGTKGVPVEASFAHERSSSELSTSSAYDFPCMNGWKPYGSCFESWTYKGNHANELQSTEMSGCTTVGNGFDGWCSPKKVWVQGDPWHTCRMCGVSWVDQARRVGTIAQAYVSKASQGLWHSLNGDDEVAELVTAQLQRWFGSDSDEIRNEATSVLQHITNVLTRAEYWFKDDRNTWGWVYSPFQANDKGNYEIYLGKPYIETPHLSSKVGTLTHEASHFNPVRRYDNMYCDTVGCLNMAKNEPSKARWNADHWAYFIDAVNLGRMENRPPPR
eukprot:TRINITY_DN39735_c0_g1_i2.p1 TRINITY_DN39735_c0_g1~~TRINITY_DN39735_c0_g1_i2.p1  ORF type:complete len:526 (-),score=68.03 TRINITY_DN39735_c0_g1_i2:52-1629(-)